MLNTLDGSSMRYDSIKTWTVTLRDAFQEYMRDTAKFFYIRNSKFVALFRYEDGKPIAEVVPS